MLKTVQLAGRENNLELMMSNASLLLFTPLGSPRLKPVYLAQALGLPVAMYDFPMVESGGTVIKVSRGNMESAAREAIKALIDKGGKLCASQWGCNLNNLCNQSFNCSKTTCVLEKCATISRVSYCKYSNFKDTLCAMEFATVRT